MSADVETHGRNLAAASSWIYSSFAAAPGGGNPAGVVVSPAPLPTETCQAVASILSVPTTGFVVEPPTAPAFEVDVRFFTPDTEIDACGHVTIAVATALVERGVWRWGDDVEVHARGGQFPLALRDGLVLVRQRLRHIEPAPVTWPDIREALGPVASHPTLPLATAGTGLCHLIIPLAHAADLSALELDMQRVAGLARQAAADTICVFALSEPGKARVRDLWAAIGALEEPASGTTAAALALYLHQTDRSRSPASELVIEQGVEMGRPSRIEVSVVAHDTAVVRGRAYKLLSGPVELCQPRSRRRAPTSSTEPSL